MPTALERAEVRFGASFVDPERVPVERMSPTDVLRFNRFFSRNAPALVSERVRLERRTIRSVSRYARGELDRLNAAMRARGSWDRFADDAARNYLSLWTPSASDAEMRRRLRADARADEALQGAILAEIREASREAGNVFDDLFDVFFRWMILSAESGAAFAHAYIRQSQDDVIERVVRQVEIEDLFSAEDGAFVDVVFSREPRLLDSVLDRANKIKLAGFSDSMFEELRDVVRVGMYENITGGLGAREVARRIGRTFEGRIPDEVFKRKTELWARTEGAVVQNDALMEIGKDAEMNGKAWQTVGIYSGLNKVRDAHIDNEADGVIHIDETFSDGSTDGGSGSRSPWACRCAVGPALLPK